MQHIPPPGYVVIKKLMHIYPVFNTGISFGYLAWIPNYVFVLVNSVIVFIISRLSNTYTYNKLGYTLLTAGAISNIIDRITYGGVIDIFHVYFYSKNLFICNIADIYITLGCMMILLKSKTQKLL